MVMDVTRVSLRAVYEGDLLVLQANTSERVFSLGDRTFQTANWKLRQTDLPPLLWRGLNNRMRLQLDYSSWKIQEQLLDVPVEALPDIFRACDPSRSMTIEGLRDLRFGDVLHEIVRWLQHNSADADDRASEDDVFDNDEVVERLRRVVQFAARECRSQDEDAITCGLEAAKRPTSAVVC
ncbi:hypothetical protein PC116_g11493 [Phytophthora cactorum]|uniref:Uncharacterized protein n=1 Tax=Phytophthora cactorum TaxID=29920 RepID=A0A8T0ZCC8_9STRA|nr:hypothetical protein PC112_g8297 [Phytophthora cactorum]KAG2831092.1 hypothetical protein PC111_g7145 [Phytophthora cactorum]KAG2859889.1 hypothetical protein PC113_g8551 [Phytophthora cactorum]KAG2912222.1 hypothetical protein PC114_g8994 [Phytophthora cactorum]KAG2927302.1 hypothetical protein PC115_g7612 [Phytophthora cactorum]